MEFCLAPNHQKSLIIIQIWFKSSRFSSKYIYIYTIYKNVLIYELYLLIYRPKPMRWQCFFYESNILIKTFWNTLFNNEYFMLLFKHLKKYLKTIHLKKKMLARKLNLRILFTYRNICDYKAVKVDVILMERV